MSGTRRCCGQRRGRARSRSASLPAGAGRPAPAPPASRLATGSPGPPTAAAAPIYSAATRPMTWPIRRAARSASTRRPPTPSIGSFATSSSWGGRIAGRCRSRRGPFGIKAFKSFLPNGPVFYHNPLHTFFRGYLKFPGRRVVRPGRCVFGGALGQPPPELVRSALHRQPGQLIGVERLDLGVPDQRVARPVVHLIDSEQVLGQLLARAQPGVDDVDRVGGLGRQPPGDVRDPPRLPQLEGG